MRALLARQLVAAVDPTDSNLNAFIVFTPIAADYTSLGSFGTIDYVCCARSDERPVLHVKTLCYARSQGRKYDLARVQ